MQICMIIKYTYQMLMQISLLILCDSILFVTTPIDWVRGFSLKIIVQNSSRFLGSACTICMSNTIIGWSLLNIRVCPDRHYIHIRFCPSMVTKNFSSKPYSLSTCSRATSCPTWPFTVMDSWKKRFNSSQMLNFNFKHFLCNEFLTFFGNAGI